MKILFVTSRYPTKQEPGESPAIAHQEQAIRALNHEVDVLFFDTSRYKLNYLKALWEILWRVQIRNEYDIVHAHYGALCGLIACLQTRCPTVVTYRGSDVMWKRERPVSRIVAGLAKQNIVMTAEMKQILGRADAHIVPYGIDLRVFKPYPRQAARAELGLPPDAPLVLFPYDPTRTVKRYDLVQQAIEILKPEFPDLHIVTIQAKPPEVVATYMNACDALVLTSDREGAPVAIREALACTLPIVSVDVGDVADLIRETAACHIVSRNPTDIADKLAMVLRSGQRSNGWLVAQTMDLSNVAARVVAVYETTLRQRPDKYSKRYPNTLL